MRKKLKNLFKKNSFKTKYQNIIDQINNFESGDTQATETLASGAEKNGSL